jgi:hypothetical protein
MACGQEELAQRVRGQESGVGKIFRQDLTDFTGDQGSIGVGNRESGVGGRESGVGGRESGVGSRGSGVGGQLILSRNFSGRIIHCESGPKILLVRRCL